MAGSGTHDGVWSDDRIARELEAWFAQRMFEVWPSYRAFARDGRKRLHAAVVRTGGARRWAPELGVQIVEHRRGRRLHDDDIEQALRALLRAHQPVRFPSQPWLVQHGPPGLASAVRSSGGAERWAARLCIPGPSPARWTDERLEAELRRLCAGRQSWPTRADFKALSATGVLRAVDQGHGSRWWAERLCLDSSRLRKRRSPARARADPPRAQGSSG